VALDGVDRHEEAGGDLAIGESAGGEVGNLGLSPREVAMVHRSGR